MSRIIRITLFLAVSVICILNSCGKPETDRIIGSLFLGDTRELDDVSGVGTTVYTSIKWSNTEWRIEEILGTEEGIIESIEPSSGGKTGGTGTTSIAITLKRNDTGKTRSTGIQIISTGGFRPAKPVEATIRQSPAKPSDIHNPILNISWDGTAKLATGFANPLVDFNYTADPTAIEHDGRLYVYATNDQQQCDERGLDSENTYDAIKSIAIISTTDMMNWTWHGTVDINKIAPWIYASWAPSIVSRKEDDGMYHFYMYFSNSGAGTGVLTSTSPTGPWASPLDKSLIDSSVPGTEDCPWIFDPGALIDPNGTGWIAFGSSGGLIIRLGEDMASIDSKVSRIPTYYHFEANELNYINDTYVYTYNTDWSDYSDWNLDIDPPSVCSMCYMTSKTPLETESWQYRGCYFANPGQYGFDYGNNHTHLHKYKGQWYIFYHNMNLRHYLGATGGYRSVCVDEIEIDEEQISISPCKATEKGVRQIEYVNPYEVQQMEMTAGTHKVHFQSYGSIGNMTASSDAIGSILIKGIDFDRKAESLEVSAIGTGRLEVRKDNPYGQVISIMDIDNKSMKATESTILSADIGVMDLCFLFEGKDLQIDSWRFL